jgi:glucose-1-phosphate cytidylyltransferase
VKAVILAGGFGTRISEETLVRPKPMIDLGGRPVLWHIMKIYSTYGVNDFIVCCGYKGYMIKEYFANYSLHMSDITIDLQSNTVDVHQSNAEPWKVTLIDTGQETQTGGRLKRVANYLDDEDFCFTYGDGLCDVNVAKLIDFHRSHGTLATVTAVQPPGRFGQLKLDQQKITAFNEKPEGDNAWVNGGFFVLSPRTIDYIKGDSSVWEREPLETLAAEGNLSAFLHRGFWQPMDTLRDKIALEEMWNDNRAPWKVWD